MTLAHDWVVAWAFLMTAVMLAAGATGGRPDRGDTSRLLEPPAVPVGNEFQLQPLGEGFILEERGFTARIAGDGAVTLTDHRILFDGVGPLASPHPAALPLSTLQDLLFGRPSQPLPVWRPAGPFPGSPAQPLDHGLLCPESSTCHALPGGMVVVGVGVGANLTDEFLRALGQDPYRIRKARFLAATFEVRMRLAVQAYQDDLRTSLDRLPEGLAELWHDPRYSASEKRRILFELWREADDSKAGAQARDIVMTFIRRILPCRSSQAYPPAELHALQVGEGRAFSPYGVCGR